MEKEIRISITAGTIIKAVLVLVAAWAVYHLRDLVLIILTAIVIASAIEPAVVAFGRWKVPRVLAVIGVYLMMFGVLFVIFYFFL
ncbi:MAG: hypothetical protein RIQ56_975, partial [Candidatus Parcubacteria bacterium]